MAVAAAPLSPWGRCQQSGGCVCVFIRTSVSPSGLLHIARKPAPKPAIGRIMHHGLVGCCHEWFAFGARWWSWWCRWWAWIASHPLLSSSAVLHGVTILEAVEDALEFSRCPHTPSISFALCRHCVVRHFLRRACVIGVSLGLPCEPECR